MLLVMDEDYFTGFEPSGFIYSLLIFKIGL